MPKYRVGTDTDEPVNRVFRAIADPTRRRMLARLAQGPATVSALAEPLAMAMPSVMQHLDVLIDAGIVDSQKVGRVRTVSLVPGALDPVGVWLSATRTTAERQADRLVAHLTAPSVQES